MITWSGLIGKLIEFVINKLVGKGLDLTLDEKKRACRVFLRFYNSVVELEKCFGAFVVFVEKLVQQRNTKVYNAHIGRVVADLPRLSEEFVASLNDLIGVLRVLDPTLAYLLSQVQIAKRAFIAGASSIFNRDVMPLDVQPTDGESPGFMHFTIPADSILDTDTIENLYKEVRSEQYMNVLAFPIPMGGPPLDILRSHLTPMSTEVLVYADEVIKLAPLLSRFKDHQRLLTAAREKLRVFIEQRFSLEDLLYVEARL